MVAGRTRLEGSMRTMNPWIAGALLAATVAWTPAVLAAGAAAHSHAEADVPAKLALNKGRKWTTDAPLRTGMARIRDLAAGGVERAHAGTLDAKAAAALGGQVEQEVAGIVANCKLEPQADAMLHLVIADIGTATDVLAGKAAGKTPEQGLLHLAAAVNAYGKHFDHPGLKPVSTGH